MALKADNRGFLIADSATDISDMVSGIDGVRADTSAILALLRDRLRQEARREKAGEPPGASRQQSAQASSRASSISIPVTRARDSQGRFVANANGPELTPITRAVDALTRQQAQEAAQRKRDAAASAARGESPSDQPRDARGRFGSGGANPSSNSTSGGAADRANGVVSRLKGLGGGGTGGEMEKIDPTVGAAREASQLLATPVKAAAALGSVAIGRGFGGQKDGAIPWYQRIWGELRMTRRESSAYEQAQTRSLKEIERKSGGTPDGKGGGGLLGGLLSKGGGLLGSLGGGLLRGGAGLLKRLPLLGALFAGGSALASIFGPDDPLKSPEENRKQRFTGAGSGIGAVIGGALGSFLGPLGTVGGAMIGDKVGELVGGWLAEVDWGQVGKDISAAWDSAVGFVKDTWNGVTKSASEAWTGLVAGAKAFIKDKLGIDVDAVVDKVKALAAPVVDAVKARAAPIVGAVQSGADTVAQYGRDRVTKMAEPIGRAATAIGGKLGDRWNDAKAYLVGASATAGVDAGTVAKISNFESGFNADAAPIRKDGTRISSAHGYGQFLDGTWTDMVNKYGAKYGVAGAGKLTKEQAAAYRNDKTVQAGLLAEFTRENIDKGRKYGGTNDDANVYAFHNLGDKDAKNLLQGMKANPSVSVRDALLAGTTSDKERARIEQVISGNRSLYGDGNISAAAAYAKMGQVMQRGDAFAADARASQAGVPVIAAAAPATTAAVVPPAFKAAAPSVAVPAPLPVPAVAEASVPTQLNNEGPIPVIVADKGMAGQDVKDRRIAQVATGGLVT